MTTMHEQAYEIIDELLEALEEIKRLAIDDIYRARTEPTRELLLLRLGRIVGTAHSAIGKVRDNTMDGGQD